ncbi:MAG TPA: RHS repeat-associated core domain-containing protein, partial [Saprospiraceae bacterium]
DIENMTFTYYDDYKQNDLVFQNSSLAFQSVTWTSNPDADTWQKFDRTFGKITGVSVRTLNSNQWHHTVKYYDKKQRPIQTVSTLPSGGTSRFSALYNFTGSVLQSRSEKHSQVAFRRYVYDHKGRVQKLYFKFNNQPEVILSSASYDPLGQTTDKKLFPDEGGTNFLQSIDYSYNIKGWLKKVNSATGSDAGETDYFGLEMAYESDDFLTSSTARKDGLITAVRWRNDLTSTQNLFSFDYDSWNRLQHANYKTGTAAAWNANDFYSEKDISYDRNGNLTGLKRYRKVDHMAVKELIDDLTYQYGSGGNQLMAVAEGSTSSTKDLGFKDGNVSTDDYAYDPNGNVLFDKNKNIVRINYNYLDLPEFLKFSDSTSTEISYDATGKRVSRIERDTQNNIVLRTDYAGDLLLIDGLPAVLFHEEGRLIPPAYDNKIDNKEANGTEGYPAKNTVTISSQVISNQTYVKAVSGTGTAKSGIWPIKGTQGSSGTIPVKPGETYSFKVLGYQTVGATASLYVSSNTGDVVWPGAVLPQGSVNETWVTSTFTVPAGVTEINVGVLWQTPSNGHTFFVNRVALYNTDWELQYFLTDQVGSPRVVLSTQPGVTSLTATFETENQTTEANQFLNIKTTNITSIPVIANATPGGNESIYLDQNYNIGPARSIKVFPGDKVDASAHSYYSSASGLSKTLGSVMAAKLIQVMTSTAPVPIDQGVNNAYAFSDNQDPGFALSRNQGLTSPSAFLNYILFDINYTPLEAKSFPISPTAGSRLPVTMDQVSVKQPGYMFVYLSFDNNSPYQVHFDDFKIRHTESPVIQITDYYPYGMTAMNWVREGETENWFTFQQKEYDKKSGLNDFHARQYDATLGRWFVQDPANQFPSPYLAMGNNPVNGIDPNGEVYVVDDIIVAAVGFVFGYLAYGAINDDWDSDAVKAGLITAVMFEASYLLQGAGGAATSSMTAEMAADFAVQKGFTMLFSTAIPAIPIYESEDLNLSVRPTLSTSGVSASVSASYHKGKTDWTLSVNGGIAEGGFSTSMDLGVMYSTNNWSFGGNIGATNPAGEAKWNERVNFAAGYSRDGIGVMANLGWQGEFGKKFDQVSGWTLAYNRDGYQLSYNETYNTGYGKRTDGKGTDLPTWSRKLTFASARDNIGFTYGDTRNANGHVITGEIARGDYKMSFGKGSAASAITPTKFYYQQFDFEWNSIKALLGKIFK